MPIFACQNRWKEYIKSSNHLFFSSIHILGLTGFDSKLRWYVSMRSEDCKLHNPFGQKINWQQQVCSRCLIEVQ